MAKTAPARDAVRWRTDEHAWLDHASVTDDDLEWLGRAKRLTLWAVTVPDGWFARHPSLEWLDIRGGSGTSAEQLRGCDRLRYLCVNQVRGMTDLSAVGELRTLEMLALYGLPRVADLPDLSGLHRLRRLEVGSMKGLRTLAPALAAPALEELQLQRAVSLAPEDAGLIRDHPTLREFGWYAEDVPLRVWQPVVAEVDRPQPRTLHPEDWFAAGRR